MEPVVLFKRRQSKLWQARLRIQPGKWIEVSTGTTHKRQAGQVAQGKYEELLARLCKGEPGVSRRFSDITQLVVNEMRAAIKQGSGRSVYRGYIQAIEQYLVPALGAYLVHNIDSQALSKLDAFRREAMGQIPTRSTINTHNVALNRVMEVAHRLGYVRDPKVPKLPNRGRKSVARPSFSDDEFRAVMAKLWAFRGTGHSLLTKYLRTLLYDYVVVLASTGMRSGTEALGLQWSGVKVRDDGTVELSVSGKTGRRTLIARDVDGELTQALERLRERQRAVRGQVTSLLVFALQDGRPMNLERMATGFHIALKECGLLKNEHGQTRSLYSIRHMYATQRILEGIDLATLSVQMGTSIAMLERHYSKLRPFMRAGVLSGRVGHVPPELRGVEASLVELRQLVVDQASRLKEQDKLIRQLLGASTSESTEALRG